MRHMDFIVGTIVHELKKRRERAGKIQIQKLVYFLKNFEVRVPYSFIIAKYGPFSGELSDKIKEMEFNKYIKSLDNAGTDYILNINKKELIDYDERYDDVVDRISFIIETLPSLNFDDLELYATVHYCYNSLEVIFEEVNENMLTEEVKKWKNDKFTDEDIKNAFINLQKNELI